MQANISQHLYISLCYLFSQLIWWHRYTLCPMTLSWHPMGVKAHHFAGHTATWPHKDSLLFWQKCGIWHHEMQYLTVYEQRLHRYIRTLLTYLHFVIWQIDSESHYIRNSFRVYVDDAHLNTWIILSWWIVACSASSHYPFIMYCQLNAYEWLSNLIKCVLDVSFAKCRSFRFKPQCEQLTKVNASFNNFDFFTLFCHTSNICDIIILTCRDWWDNSFLHSSYVLWKV